VPTPRELHPSIKAVLLAFGLLLFGLLFQELVSLLVAILITILIAIPLSALATQLEARRVPRPVGAFLGLLLIVGVVGGILALVIPPFVDETKLFVEEVPSITDSLQEQIGGVIGAEPGEVGASIQTFLQRYTNDPGELIGPLASIGLNVLGVIGALILILLTAAYIAISPEPLIAGALSLFPPERRAWVTGVMERLRSAWVGWQQGVLIDMLITGVLLYLGLTLIGLDFAVVFAVISALLVLIPYFGAIAGGIPPVLFALTDSPGKALLALAIYVLIQQIESNLTIPLVMAQRVKLHPAVVAIGVVIVGQLFGFLGLFVAVPILSMIVIGVDEIWVKPMESERGVKPVVAGRLPESELGPPMPEEGVGTATAPAATGIIRP
jgi:predicted PurR-regulated permease PerM